YNLRPLELEGALGLTQLEKLPGFLAARRDNARLFQQMFEGLDCIGIQQETGESSWFGFAMTLRGRLAGQRQALVQALAAAEIECRPVVAGNFLANPVIDKLDHSVAGPVPAAENIDANALFTGNHHYPIAPQIERLRQVVDDVAARF
ncbi:MAG TPA: DegT/DnrJ/EryC1/StrS family aminotransferase, partial [Paracoccus sp. (in: a-proteobacteria)]|nr:DegT/DnrJ/EryC1/StrS family aminotransferase [Paracoccus sp. (in: a-proteobacteria)]